MARGALETRAEASVYDEFILDACDNLPLRRDDANRLQGDSAMEGETSSGGGSWQAPGLGRITLPGSRRGNLIAR